MNYRLTEFLHAWKLEKLGVYALADCHAFYYDGKSLRQWPACVNFKKLNRFQASEIYPIDALTELYQMIPPSDISGQWEFILLKEDKKPFALVFMCRSNPGKKRRRPANVKFQQALYWLTCALLARRHPRDFESPFEIIEDFIISADKSHNLEDLLWTLYQYVARLIKVDAFFFGFLSPDMRFLELPFIVDQGVQYPRVVQPIGRKLATSVLKTGKPLLMNRSREELQALQQNPEQTHPFGDVKKLSASIMVIPVFIRQRLIGVLSAQSYTFNAYSHEDIRRIQPLISHFAIALENARLFHEKQEQVKIFSIAEAIQKRAWKTRRINTIILELLNLLSDNTPHHGFIFFLRDSRSTVWKATLKLNDDSKSYSHFKINSPEKKSELFRRMLHQKTAQIYSEVTDEEWMGQIFPFSPRSLLLLPMIVDRDIKGALAIAEANDMAFSETDAKWFGHLMSRIGMIFQRHQYLKDLSRERDRLTAILNHLQEGVQILDHEFNILFQNRWSKDKLNVKPESDKCYTRFFGLDAPCPQCPLLRKKSFRKPKSMEIEDQKGKIFQIILSEFKDRAGQPQILEIVRDITREKRQDAEKIRIEQLETAMAMAGSIAHELNQPLTGITGLTSLVLEDLEPEDEFSYESLKEIEIQANRMRELIRRFQNIAKIEKMNYPGKEILDLRRSTE